MFILLAVFVILFASLGVLTPALSWADEMQHPYHDQKEGLELELIEIGIEIDAAFDAMQDAAQIARMDEIIDDSLGMDDALDAAFAPFVPAVLIKTAKNGRLYLTITNCKKCLNLGFIAKQDAHKAYSIALARLNK